MVVVVVDVDDELVEVLVDADVVVVARSVVLAAVVEGEVDVDGALAAVAINSSNWFSARLWARANSMPVPHSW